MIELRWLEYEIIHSSPMTPISDWAETKVKLQYRYQISWLNHVAPELRWSEWIDVPTVKDKP